MRFDRRRLVSYALLPAIAAIVAVGMYFSDVGWMQTTLAPAHQREFGLLENFQNLLILIAVITAWRASSVETDLRLRMLWRFAAWMSLIVFLEEIDWGSHYYRWLKGIEQQPGEYFNLHNQGSVNDWLKRSVDVGMGLLFVVVPLLARRLPDSIARWAPSPYSVFVLLMGVAASKFAHGLEDAGWPNNEGLRSNISEFRETFTYWVVMLYFRDIAARRRAANAAPDDAAASSASRSLDA